MRNNFLLLSFLTAGTFFIGACNKDDDNTDTENWAAAVAGTYTGTSQVECGPGDPELGTVTFTRTGDKQLNMQGTFGSDTYCLDSLTMNSSSIFIINEYDGCTTDPATGNGSFSGNSVNFFVDYAGWCQFTIQGTK